MSKRQFKSQASSSRAASGIGFGGFGSAATATTLSYLVEPPNLTSINDANVVVALKNLSKKDGTTKSKALEDLRAYVQAHPFEQDGGVEEPIIEAWVRFYPRVSIDNSRRVRELSHHLQVELLKSARKRMEKYIPKVVGSWLAGTFDRDRAVARAASDGLKSFLDTDTKELVFWKRCQVQILGYAQEAINETPQTLSDERTMSADDIQAKYFRVVSSSISLVLSLLIKLNNEDISKHQDKYEEYLAANKKLWALAAAEDSFLRKTVDRLLIVCLAKQPVLIENELELLGQSFITDALRGPQASSSIELLQALSSLTSKYPAVWTTSYKGKKAPLSRLRNFLEKGSQGGPPEFWQIVQSLLRALPDGVLPSDLVSTSDFLQAFRKGISSRTEPRSNAVAAWSSYFNMCVTLAENSTSSIPKGKLYEEVVFPVFEQYLHPTAENSQWNVGNVAVLARAYELCTSAEDQELQTSFQQDWTKLVDGAVGRLRTSQPEQSKDYHKSQAAIISESQRWFGLLHEVVRISKDASLADFTGSPSTKIIEAALDAMINRNGKPYSTAATIETALRLAPRVLQNGSLLQLVETRLKQNIEMLIVSQSSEYIVSIIFLLASLPNQEAPSLELWRDAIIGVLAQPVGSQKTKLITKLISHDSISHTVRSDPTLQDFILETVNSADDTSPESWTLLEAAITFRTLADTTTDKLLQQALQKLDMSGPILDAALSTLERLVKESQELLNSHSIRVTLINKLLTLTELSDSVVVSRAATLRSVIESSAETGQTGSEKTPVLHVIKENLGTANQQSLSIQTLVGQAKAVMANSKDSETSAALLPERSQWSKELESLLEQPPSPALGVMRPFAGAVFLVQGSPTTLSTDHPRDTKGYSVALRMAMYTSFLIAEDNFALVPRDVQVDMLYLLCLTAELARDQIDLLEEGGLFLSHQHADIVEEVREYVAQTQRCFAPIIDAATTWRQKPTDNTSVAYDPSAVIHELFSKLLRASSPSSPGAYYSSRALSHLVSTIIDAHGWHNDEGEEWFLGLDIFKPSTSNVLGATAIIIGLEEQLATSKLVSNFCNRLISDIAGASAESDKTLQLLVLLNATLTVYDIGDIPVAQNRLVFAVKQILSWTEQLAQESTGLSSEACRALHRLLPAIKEVYGTYWETTISFLFSIWGSCSDGNLSDERLPMVGMSLKLYSILASLEDANDDLEDALAGPKDQISRSLVNLLKLQRSKESQPLKFVDDILSRVVVGLPTTGSEDVSEFYPLVASDFRMIQSAAYHILHKALPEAQQQISVDVLLESRDARLPEELLSLLLDAPTIHDFSDEELSEFPCSIRGYLLSWHLVFDSYLNASYKVRNDYTESLKSDNYLDPLLSFLFDVLGHSIAKPINLDKSRFGASTIQDYDMWTVVDSESSDRDMQQLLLNLYYLALKFVPNLVKSWWFDCKSKQTRIAVDSWTEKFFSPLVIQDTLEDVERWAEEQEAPADDEKDLIVRVSKKSREIFAAYEVDDMTMQIAIRLPANYPLEGVKVDGINRVAVSEKKWTSWLMITQGVITFSNGSITDGLAIFRKNVTGALKGQTECAICYSIISSDKKMPDKRCQTCKNLFHSSCLFKWFASSNQSTCPLCRNPFNYGTDTTRRARERDQAGVAR